MDDEKIQTEGEGEYKPLTEDDVEDYPEDNSPDAAEDEEETENSDDDDDKSESEEATETETESEETEQEKTKEPEKEQEKQYVVNGRVVTADELHREFSMLNAEFTKRSQRLAELEGKSGKKEDVLSEFDQEEVEKFKKLSKALGYVQRNELDEENAQKAQNVILREFIAKHPEYNDPANSSKLYGVLKGYNLELEYLPKSLEKAHQELNPDKPDEDKDKEKVRQEKVNRQSVGVNSGARTKESSGNYTPQQIEVMKKMGVWED